jgi:hypothetical protein
MGSKAPARSAARREALARALLRVLERRGVALDAAMRTRAEDSTDTDVLDGWLDRAATTSTRADVLDLWPVPPQRCLLRPSLHVAVEGPREHLHTDRAGA